MNIKKSNTRIYLNIQESMKLNPLHDIIFIHNRHFLLFERADLTASTLLQRIRGEGYKIQVWLELVQIFHAIPRALRLLRNSPRPWVRHTQSPAVPGSL